MRATIEWSRYEASKALDDWNAAVRTVTEALHLCTSSSAPLFTWKVYFTLMHCHCLLWNGHSSPTEPILAQLRLDLSPPSRGRLQQLYRSIPRFSVTHVVRVCELVVTMHQALFHLHQHRRQESKHFLDECELLLLQVDSKAPSGIGIGYIITLLRFASHFQAFEFRTASTCLSTPGSPSPPLHGDLLKQCTRYMGSARTRILSSPVQSSAHENQHLVLGARRFATIESEFVWHIQIAQFSDAKRSLMWYRTYLLQSGEHGITTTFKRFTCVYFVLGGVLCSVSGLPSIAVQWFSRASSLLDSLPDDGSPNGLSREMLNLHVSFARSQLEPLRSTFMSPVTESLLAPMALYAFLKSNLQEGCTEEALSRCSATNNSLGNLHFEIWTRIHTPHLVRSALDISSKANYIEGQYHAVKALLKQKLALADQEGTNASNGLLGLLLRQSSSLLASYNAQVASLLE